jgi:hypothetical protein
VVRLELRSLESDSHERVVGKTSDLKTPVNETILFDKRLASLKSIENLMNAPASSSLSTDV